MKQIYIKRISAIDIPVNPNICHFLETSTNNSSTFVSIPILNETIKIWGGRLCNFLDHIIWHNFPAMTHSSYWQKSLFEQEFLFQTIESSIQESWNGLALAHYVGCLGELTYLTLKGRTWHLTQNYGHGLDHTIVHNIFWNTRAGQLKMLKCNRFMQQMSFALCCPFVLNVSSAIPES